MASWTLSRLSLSYGGRKLPEVSSHNSINSKTLKDMKNGFRSWHYVNAANKQTNKQTKTHIFGWLKNQSKVQKTQPCRELPFLGCKPRLVANFCSSRTDKTKSELVQAAKEESTATTNPSTVPQNSNQHVKHLPKCTCYFVKVQSKIAHKYLSEICLGTTGMHYTHILHAQLSLHIFSWI